MTRRGVLAAAFAFAVGGCGFRLRRWDLAAAFASVRIDAAHDVDLGRELQRTLESADVRVADDGDADVVIRLAEQREDRRPAAVTAGGRTAEYELSIRVLLSAHDGDGTELIAERELLIERVARLDRENLAGSREEETLLMAEMRSDLVGRIIRALNAVSAAAGD